VNSKRSPWLLALVGGLLFAAPCPAQDAPAKVVIPATKDIAAIHVEIYKTTAKEGYELKLKDEKSMQPVLDWLNSIDFDPAKGRDGKALKLGHFGHIKIVTKDNKTHQFGLSDKTIVYGWLWAADTDKLVPILKKARGK
jgi:hypothetical protein